MTITEGRPGTAQAEAPHVQVLVDRCAGCQECVVRCPTGALSMETGSWTVLADDALCVGCRQCERTCPFAAITVAGPLRVDARVLAGVHRPGALVGSREETRPGISSWEEALAEASRCLDCPDPTCTRGCPVHNDIPAFVRALAVGDLDGAHEVLSRTTFLPDVCSRVCDQALQCEGSCSWSLAGGAPVAIGALERFIADHAPVPAVEARDTRGHGLSVAIVGSGPAGIGAAFELTRSGAAVTVFEKDDEPGGLLAWGIPEFTLPRAVARRPWDALRSAGVALHCGTEITPATVPALLQAHDAVILAQGAGVPLRLPVQGGDLEGVCDATQFLREARDALAEKRPLGLLADRRPSRTVLVLGAGNTAMDVARLARRFGHEAICVDWLDRRFAPVRPDELSEAAEEGVDVRFCTTLERLEGEAGRVRRAVLSETVQTKKEKLPKVVRRGASVLDVDLVVMAMGYRLDPAFSTLTPMAPVRRVARGLPAREWQASGILAGGAPAFARHQPVGTLALGREVGRLSAGLGAGARVWVAGDALVGPSTVVEAMAQGRRAAQAIIEQRPARRRAALTERAPAVLIAYESRGGRTARLAEELGAALARRGASVALERLSAVGLPKIAAADLVVVGTWVEGFVVAGVEPARATRTWLKQLPSLGARKFAVFCTYGVSARSTLAQLRSSLEGNGALVVAEAAFGPRPPATAQSPFLEQIIDELLPAPSVDELERCTYELAAANDPPAAATRTLIRYAGGRLGLLDEARARLVERLGRDAGNVAASAALTLCTRALAELRPPPGRG